MERGISAEDAAYFERQYGLKLRMGMKFRYTGDAGGPREGTLVGTCAAKLRIRMDGEDEPGIYHPTWELAPIEEAKP